MTEQIEKLIENFRDYYRQLAAFCQALAIDSEQSERVILVSSHLKDYELLRAAMLDEQLREHPNYSGILKTWLQIDPACIAYTVFYTVHLSLNKLACS